jgi:hypothetical protein
LTLGCSDSDYQSKTFFDVAEIGESFAPPKEGVIFLVDIGGSKRMVLSIREAFNLMDLLSELGGLWAFVFFFGDLLRTIFAPVEERLNLARNLFLISARDQSKTLEDRIEWLKTHKRFDMTSWEKLIQTICCFQVCLRGKHRAISKLLEESDKRVDKLLDIRTLQRMQTRVHYLSQLLLTP